MKRIRCLYLALILGFILGTKGGWITLWAENRPEPVKIFPCRTALLPEADQEALERGIRIDKKEQLFQLLEDYLS